MTHRLNWFCVVLYIYTDAIYHRSVQILVVIYDLLANRPISNQCNLICWCTETCGLIVPLGIRSLLVTDNVTKDSIIEYRHYLRYSFSSTWNTIFLMKIISGTFYSDLFFQKFSLCSGKIRFEKKHFFFMETMFSTFKTFLRNYYIVSGNIFYIPIQYPTRVML